MTMAVRCPNCGALFRITTEQLDAHDGDVRCGRCLAVFDGLQELSLPAVDTPVPGTARDTRARIETGIRIEPGIRTDAAPVAETSLGGAPSDVPSPLAAPAAHDSIPAAAPGSPPSDAPGMPSDVSDVWPPVSPDVASSAASDTPPAAAPDVSSAAMPAAPWPDDEHRDRRTPTLTEPADVTPTVKPADEFAPVAPDRSVPIFARMLDAIRPTGNVAAGPRHAPEPKEPAAAVPVTPESAADKLPDTATQERTPPLALPVAPPSAPPENASGGRPAAAGAASTAPATPAPMPKTPVVPALDPDFLSGESALTRRRRRLWGGGALLLALLIIVQLIFLFRVGLAAYYPAFKPVLTGACELFGCTVPLPQRPDQITIESSDLSATDPAHPDRVAVSVTLRNRGSVTTGYPALDLTLTDGQDRPVARRIFMPAQYLKPDQDAQAGIAPDAQVSVRLKLDITGLEAAGFRMEVLPASGT
ncbi:MAG: DUF3426 domain-containing protein [Burkholderiales bacterium]